MRQITRKNHTSRHKKLDHCPNLDGSHATIVAVSSDAQAIEVGAPVPLFPTRVVGGAVNVQRQQYVVSPDGQRFLINTVLEESGASRITIILNLMSKS